MKKFEFRLQKLLDIREAAEKKVQNELAELVNEQNILRLKCDEYKRKISEERVKLSKKIGEKLSYDELLMFERFVDITGKAIDHSEQQAENMECDIQKVREKLAETSKERKVVENLKERRWREYLYEFNRETVKENDDMNQKIFIRRRAADIY